jgi:hypothetical protein
MDQACFTRKFNTLVTLRILNPDAILSLSQHCLSWTGLIQGKPGEIPALARNGESPNA